MIDRNDCARQVSRVRRQGGSPVAWVWRWAQVGVAGLVLVVVAGCGSSAVNGRYPIQGTVEFEGKPLDKGTIEFSTADRSELTGATIENGKYAVPAEQGLKPGKYTVRVSATDDGAAGGAPPPPGPENTNQVAKERIPPEYNINSKLTADVSESGGNTFDFKIPQ